MRLAAGRSDRARILCGSLAVVALRGRSVLVQRGNRRLPLGRSPESDSTRSADLARVLGESILLFDVGEANRAVRLPYAPKGFEESG